MAGYEVGSAYVTVLPKADGFGRTLDGQVGPGFTAAGAAGGQRMGAAMPVGGKASFLAAGGALAAAFAGKFVLDAGTAIVKGVASYLTDAVSAASDLSETQNKVGEIFGDAAAAIEAFSEDSTRNILLTKQEALDGAATFGIFGKSAGLAGDDLAGFSTDMVALASDLASFNNTSTDDAVTAIGAALRGESEPIRAYGVLLDDATLKAQAFAMGIYDGTGALTPQQRVLAAQAEILKQTVTQQGDAARTAGGFANQQKILNKEFEDTKATIGAALLPAVTELTKAFGDVAVPVLQEMAAWVTENKDEIQDFVIAVGDGALLVVGAFVQMGFGTLTLASMLIRSTGLMIDGFLGFVEAIIGGAEAAFGWVPGVGDKLRSAQDDIRTFRDDTRDKFATVTNALDETASFFGRIKVGIDDVRSALRNLDGQKATISVNAQGNAVSRLPDGSFQVAGTSLTGRATGGPVTAGTPYLVGEFEPEVFVPGTNGTILNQSQLAAIRGSSEGQNVYVQNPFTGEYLLAQVGAVAQGQIAESARSAAGSRSTAGRLR